MTAKRKTIQTILDQVSDCFAHADLTYGHGTGNPLDEAAWLVCAQLNIPTEVLQDHLQKNISADDERHIEDICTKRITTRKPLAYLLNEAWFAGHKFYVDKRVIIPRSHIGDCIVDEFQPWINTNNVHRILDLCTGSACIAITAALSLPDTIVDAVDISDDALDVAKININNYLLQDRVHILKSDLFTELAGTQYNLILANPPYVGTEEYARLPAEYHFEPKLALHSQRQGLKIPIRILSESADFLSPDGHLMMEVGASGQLLQDLLPGVPFTWLATESEETSVFLLTASQLTESQHIFTRLLH